MALLRAALVQPQSITTTERDMLVLAGGDVGRLVWNETLLQLQKWDGTDWVEVLCGPILEGGVY